MRVKIFYGSGSEGLRGLESEVNSWLAKLASGAQILDKHTAACTVADTADGEYLPASGDHHLVCGIALRHCYTPCQQSAFQSREEAWVPVVVPVTEVR